MLVEFMKIRFYNGQFRNKGDVVEMPADKFKIYSNFKVVKPYYKKKDLKDLSYKQLQGLCKKNNLPAVGAKDELIKSLESRSK